MQITQAPPRPPDDVGIEPLPPEEGATPEEIVRGFIDAAASTARRAPGRPPVPHAGRPRESWSDETGITVISPDYAAVTTDAGAVDGDRRRWSARSTSAASSPSATQRSTPAQFTLEQVEGEWRITDPPDGLILLQPDFERLYDQRDAYFLDPTGQRRRARPAVPDHR